MKNINNIALIGMAGVGKTYLGSLLAKELSFTYIEMDGLIEQQFKMKVRRL